MMAKKTFSLLEQIKSPKQYSSPGAYENLTSNAHPNLKDIAESLSFNPSDGRIWLNDQRMMLLHTNAFGAMRRELIDAFGIEKARGIYTRMGYIAGAKDARMEQERWPDADLTTLYTAQLHSLEGMVKVEPISFTFDPQKGYFDGEYNWHHSIEADEHIAAYGLSTCPTCWMLVGYATGHGSTLLGHLLIAREVSCRALGDKTCRVVAKSVDLWDDIKSDIRYLNIEGLTSSPGHEQHSDASASFTSKNVDKQSQPESSPYNYGIIGASAAYNTAYLHAQRVAPTDATVLFTGESGVGKEIFANTLHRISQRSSKPFIAVNCAAIPESLIESELFGVERGAFTGATQSRSGRFERADGGTLFLDEIGTLSLAAQGKLLRALQEGIIERVGGSHCINIDVRVIAATNIDLRQAIKEGLFREDLFYRLNVYPIHLPPLRDRRDDIPLLMNHFLNHFCRKYKRNYTGFTQQSVRTLLSYEFPGNIRELQNLVERGVISANEGELIDLPHLFFSGETLPQNVLSVSLDKGSGKLTEGASKTSNLFQSIEQLQGATDGNISLDKVERELVETAIARANGNLSAAARMLGMTRSQITYRYKQYKLNMASKGNEEAL